MLSVLHCVYPAEMFKWHMSITSLQYLAGSLFDEYLTVIVHEIDMSQQIRRLCSVCKVFCHKKSGWHEQQFAKLQYIMKAKNDIVMVIDCKNILVSPVMTFRDLVRLENSQVEIKKMHWMHKKWQISTMDIVRGSHDVREKLPLSITPKLMNKTVVRAAIEHVGGAENVRRYIYTNHMTEFALYDAFCSTFAKGQCYFNDEKSTNYVMWTKPRELEANKWKKDIAVPDGVNMIGWQGVHKYPKVWMRHMNPQVVRAVCQAERYVPECLD